MNKNTLTILFAIILSAISPNFIHGQVGINTENPLASLDVVGNLRVTDVTVNNTSNDVLVLGADNIVYRNTAISPNSAATSKAFVNATGNATITLLDVDLLSGWYKVPFANEKIDESLSFDAGTNSVFTAPSTGVYYIVVQFTTSALVTLGDVGVAIFKRVPPATTFTITSEQMVTPAVSVGSAVSRRMESMIKLNKDDSIIFGVKVPGLSVTLVGGNVSYFNIIQVK